MNIERLVISYLRGVLWLYVAVDGDNQQFMLCIKFAYVFSSNVKFKFCKRCFSTSTIANLSD